VWLEIADAQVTTPEQVEIEPEVLAEIINKHLRLGQVVPHDSLVRDS
jgi:hypothetical protein